VAGIIKTQKEQTDILTGLQTAVSSSTNTVNQVNTNVTTMMTSINVNSLTRNAENLNHEVINSAEFNCIGNLI